MKVFDTIQYSVSRYRILINPHSRRGGDPQLPEAIARAFAQVSHDVVIPNSRAQFLQAAYDARAAGVDVLVIVGGDGSLNTVLSALTDGQMALAIIPAGTANDFARHLGMPTETQAACQAILTGKVVWHDLAKVGDAFFLTGGGVGVVSRIALGVHALKTRQDIIGSCFRRLAGFAYTYHSAVTLLTGTRLDCRLGISLDGQSFDATQTLALFVNKQPAIGSNLTVCPAARPDDGVLSICWIGMRPRFKNLWMNALLFFGGRHGRLEQVRMLQGKKLTLHSPEWLIFAGDGERLAEGHTMHLCVVPQALRVIYPDTDAALPTWATDTSAPEAIGTRGER